MPIIPENEPPISEFQISTMSSKTQLQDVIETVGPSVLLGVAGVAIGSILYSVFGEAIGEALKQVSVHYEALSPVVQSLQSSEASLIEKALTLFGGGVGGFSFSAYHNLRRQPIENSLTVIDPE